MSDSTAPYTSWPALIEALKAELNTNSGGISGGNPGQVLISNGASPPSWSTLLTIAIPDDTASGGISRGIDAVDFQLSRAFSTEVASGDYSVIVGGQNNTNSEDYSCIVGGSQNQTVGGEANFLGGGFSNTITTSSFYSSIVGGEANYIYQSNYAFMGSGNANEVDYDYGIIIGGMYNYAENYATVINGYSNEALSQYSYIGSGTENEVSNQYAHINNGQTNNGSGLYSYIGNGTENTSAGTSSSVLNGNGNNASGDYSTILNGISNTVTGTYSTIINGKNASDKGRIGWTGYSSGTFGESGDQQAGFVVLSATISYLAGTSPTTLTSGNDSTTTNTPTTNNIINLVPLSVLHIKGTVLGMDTTTFDTGAWSVDFIIKQGYAVSDTSIVGTPTITMLAADTTFSTIQISVSADTTNGGVNLSVANPNNWNNVAYWQANLIVSELVVPFT